MDGSDPDGNCGTNTHNGAGSSQIITISWAAAKLINAIATLENGR
jgi:hypothetical protein